MSRPALARITLLGAALAVALVPLAGCGAFDPGRGGQSAPQSPSSRPGGDPSGAPTTAGPTLDLAGLVTAEALTSRLQQFEQLTMDAGGDRGPRSAGYEAVAAQIETELEATGFYDVHREPFTIQLPMPGQSQLTDQSGRVISQSPLAFSPGTPPEGLTGQLVAPTVGAGCAAADYGAEVAGQVALVDRGECTFAEKNSAAAAAGAITVIAVNNRDGGLYGTLERMLPDQVPITGITNAEGERLRGEMANGPVTVTFTFEQRIEQYETFNLFAETTGGADDNVVMAGAHLDSVPEGPGVNDNGSGSAILLETALALATADQPPNKVRFAWWGGEEWGLLGSIHWVNQQVADRPEVLSSIAGYVNVDMVASPNYVIGVYDADGSTYPGEDLPAGSDAMERIYTDYFDSIGQAWVDTEMGGSSDHAAFLPSGVPVAGLFTGAGDMKSREEAELFGGKAGEPYDSNYHESTDTWTNLSPEALVINGKASAHIIGVLAADTSAINGPGGRGNSGTPTKMDGWGYAGTV